MKSIVFLALVAFAVAHFPYADLEDKFRMSSLIIAGADNTLVSSHPYAWYFSPINNQLLPTFQLRFPNDDATHPEGIIYTIALDHIAEVMPGSPTTLIPGSMISFSSVSWYFEDTYWWYDEEFFGEIITFSLVPWTFDWESEELATHTQTNLIDNWLDTAIWLSVYPDSMDDLVDISVWFDGYHFLEDVDGQQLAIFWKVISSIGETANHRNLPMSLDYASMTFELDSDILVSEGGRKRSVRATTGTRVPSHRKSKIVTKSVMQKIADATGEKKAAGKRQTYYDKKSLKHTTGAIWLTGGYVATIIGNSPADVPDDCQIFVTVTLSLRPERP